MQNPRIKSADILQKIIEDKVFFSELKEQVGEENRAFINQLVLGTLRNFVPLNKTLNSYLKKKIAHKHRIAQYLLISAIYELAYMNTPAHAILNNTVDNIRSQSDKFLAGMANAILHNICRDLPKIKDNIAKSNKIPAEFMAILDGYDREEINKISDSIPTTAPLDLTVKEKHKELAQKLNADVLPNGTLRLNKSGKIDNLEGYNKGLWWVQDVAASLPAIIAGDLKGKTVADLCAAPGGKAAQLALTADKVYAFDISASRLERMKENIKRLSLSEKIEIINADAAEYLAKNTQLKFDLILLDAPCSATGTFRRHPEVLHIKTTEDVNLQLAEQKKLLNAATKALQKGGILIYSVCSIAKAEGEQQIESFLRENPDFEIIPLKKEDISAFGTWQDNLITANGTIRTLPFYAQNIGGMDAFFICKLQKIN